MTAEEKEITLFQDRYMSSEEDLSPIEVNLDDTLSVNDEVADYVTARPVTIGPSKPKKSGDLAVVVSMASVGRPKMVDLPSPTAVARTSRIFSLGSPSLITKPSHSDLVRTSTSSTTSMPAASTEGRPPAPRAVSVQLLSTSRASTRSISTGSETPSWTSSTTKAGSSHRSSSPTSILKPLNSPYRSSLASIPLTSACPTLKAATSAQAPLPAYTRPKTPSFLSSDPFPSIHEADPAAKPSHSRLRSLSRVFSTARMAVSSSKKGTDNRNSTPNPSRPSTPTAPALPPRRPSMTRPQTAGAGARASVMLPLTTPADNASEWDKPRSKPKMVARGAAERAPTIELPPFPDEEDDKEVEFKRRRLGRRKSFLGLI
ncbi:hypothetical protein H2201_007369 [Coniosporium apollinis]|uniref:Uncharacterized protein n=1 Tax=Coniosporium apollinis TaxID=61459 RepID=A0ABQ9NMQ0_9PEZI|nr:hypothetical protein H2201_007369 [Coniosporium apollinis]